MSLSIKLILAEWLAHHSCDRFALVSSMLRETDYRVEAAIALICSLLASSASPLWQPVESSSAIRMSVARFTDKDVLVFEGNRTHNDHFKLMLHDGAGAMLIGGRNMIYNVSLHDFKVQNKIEWFPGHSPKESCYLKGGSDELCQNYIRILTHKAPGQYIICGTNAYDPMCREFKLENGALQMEREFQGRGLCPFGPSHNSTSVFADGQLYVGSVADFAGLEPLIYREPLRTTRYDLSVLNSPDFVSSFALGDFVYFFFRETAVEYLNCGKTLYSRVARVCRHDKGGPHKFKNKWTSYLKSRLNCSVSGDFPFYFNEIQSTTEPIEGRYGDHATTLLYGVFTTPENSIPGSAICAFTFQDIMDTFEGPFKGQSTVNANWLPVQTTQVPEPRPGQCVKDSSTLPDVTLNFIKSHSMMDEAVPAFFGQPVLIRTATHYSGRFSAIAVDPQVHTHDGKSYDVLYIGTEDGKVIKAVNTKSADSFQEVEPFIIEEISVFEPSTPINSLHIVRSSQRHPRLVVGSSDRIYSIPLVRCYTDKIMSCSECVALQDPYCAWDKFNSKCRVVTQGKELIQSIGTGVHRDCGKEKLPSHSASINRDSSVSASSNSVTNTQHPAHDEPHDVGGGSSVSSTKSVPLHFTTETLAIAVASAAIGALILGFITGFFCGKKCNKEEDNQLYAATDYEYYDQRQTPNSRLTSDMQEEVTYAEPVLVNPPLNKNVNLVLSMSPKAPMKTPSTPGQPLPNVGMMGGPPDQSMGPMLALQPQPGMQPTLQQQQQGPQDIPLHYTPESYSTHGTLRTSEKYGTRGRDHRRGDYDHRTPDGYSTTRSVKKVYL
ncbi:semaphorin-1A [Hyalella azteca]|uniref:Semaphorin-1A n=1 Tax=Hyalella azteca TaxID=294128 RepID=A0A8B7PNT0_HYAAZ|nr:semaphorin-1A [Hyalella azteca]